MGREEGGGFRMGTANAVLYAVSTIKAISANHSTRILPHIVPMTTAKAMHGNIHGLYHRILTVI